MSAAKIGIFFGTDTGRTRLIAKQIAKKAVKQAGVTSKKSKAVQKAAKAAYKPLRNGKNGKAAKAAQKVAQKAA